MPWTAFPWREILAFSLPWFCSDLLFVVLAAVDVVALQWFCSVEQVAVLGAAYPLAAMNQLVLGGFLPLFVPAAARMFARGDRAGMNALYWQTATWVAVLTSPIFLVTFAAAQPLTALLYGPRYADAGAVLSLLAAAWYLDAVAGFNKLTLQVYGRFKYVLAVNAATLAVHLTGTLLLVPAHGALGTAAATCITLVVHNALCQFGLRRATGVALFEPRYASVYATIALVGLVLWLVQQSLTPSSPVGLALTALAAAIVLRFTGRRLAPARVFPVLDRIPARRLILGW
jgi:O-antigen/teichoic acid export membrane protein